MEKEVKVQKLIGVKELLQNSWKIYKKDFKKFFVIFIIFFGAPLIITGLMDLMGLIKLLIGILGTATLVAAVKESPREWKIREVIKEGLSKYVPFLLVSLLTGLIVGLGFLFIIPGIIFFVWFAFSTYVVICEDKKGFKALFRSRELVRGYWWSVFRRILVFYIIFLPVALILELLVYPLVEFGFLFYFGTFVLNMFFVPFGVIYYYLLYRNLREIKG